MSEQNNKWLFLLLPCALSKLMEWSHTNAPDNFIYKSGLWANENKERTWFKLREAENRVRYFQRLLL